MMLKPHKKYAGRVNALFTWTFLFLVVTLNAQSDSIRVHAHIEAANEYEFTDIDTAFFFSEAAVRVADSSGSQSLIFVAYKHLGNLYMTIGDYPRALEVNLIALKAAQEIKDDNGIGAMYNNIGLVYGLMGDEAAALPNYYKAISHVIRGGNREFEANIYLNTGVSHYNIKALDSSRFYLEKASALYVDLKNESGQASVANNIGLTYLDYGDPLKAVPYFQKAYDIHLELGESDQMAVAGNNLGDAWFKSGEYTKAQSSYHTAFSYALELGAYDLMFDATSGLSKTKAALQQFDSAYHYSTLAMLYKDTALTSENRQRFADLRAGYDRDSKEKELEIQKLLASQANQEKATLRIILVLSALFGLIIIYILVNRYRIKQRANQLLTEKNAVIGEKNKNITDSITYARLIQNGLLPDVSELLERFPQHFIVYHPKDIVSGDFYWTASTEKYYYFVTADCTGHGVPGGFMSVLGASLLNEVILDMDVSEPADILDLLRVKVMRALRQTGSVSDNKDGMDLVLLRFTKDMNELTYAGAYNPVWIVRNGILQQYNTDKQPVGFHPGESQQFKQHTISLIANDVIYTFTDGYADQFGGPKGKKFKYKQLETLLTAIAGLPLNEQQSVVEETFRKWKGDVEQIDDVLVVGIRV